MSNKYNQSNDDYNDSDYYDETSHNGSGYSTDETQIIPSVQDNTAYSSRRDAENMQYRASRSEQQFPSTPANGMRAVNGNDYVTRNEMLERELSDTKFANNELEEKQQEKSKQMKYLTAWGAVASIFALLFLFWSPFSSGSNNDSADSNSQSTIESLRNEADNQKSAADSANSSLNDIQSKLNEANGRADEAERRVSDKDKEISDLQNQLNSEKNKEPVTETVTQTAGSDSGRSDNTRNGNEPTDSSNPLDGLLQRNS